MPKFLTAVDMTQRQIKSAVNHPLPSAPPTPVEGQGYYDTTLKQERYWNGTTWVSPGSGMPVGGLTAQALTKKTAADFDTEWSSLPTNWERFVDVTPNVTVNPGETTNVDIATFTAGATGQMIVELLVQLDWMAGGTQLTAVDLGPSSPAPTTFPGPGIIEDVGITVLPVTAVWTNVNAGQAVTLRIAVDVSSGTSPVKVGECYGTYRIAGAADSGAYLPVGGTAGQMLTKTSATNYDATWQTLTPLPAGGTTGQVLAKTSAANYAASWQTLVTGVSSVDGRTGALVLTDKYLQLTGGTMTDGGNISLGTATGTKIGTSPTQKLGFWSATPTIQNTGWSMTAGYAATKSFNAENATLTTALRTLATLIDALKAYGILG